MKNRKLPSPENCYFTHHARERMVQCGITAEFVRIAMEAGWVFETESAVHVVLSGWALLAIPARLKELPRRPLIVIVAPCGAIVTVYWHDEQQFGRTVSDPESGE